MVNVLKSGWSSCDAPFHRKARVHNGVRVMNAPLGKHVLITPVQFSSCTVNQALA